MHKYVCRCNNNKGNIMKKLYQISLFIICTLLFISFSTYGSETGSKILVSTDWLAQHLKDPSLVVVHIGIKEDFDKEHIPGARIISMRELIVDYENGFRHELPEIEKLQSVLQGVGINRDSKIIICYSDENVVTLAARLYFTLDYAGLGDQSAILNGGFVQWKNEDRELTSDVTNFAKGNYLIKKNDEVLADKEFILKNLSNPDVVIIDARPEEQYDGSEEDPNSPRKGHIEGAVNLPFFNLQQEENANLFISDDDLIKSFKELGADKASSLIIYCGSGVWASPVYFAARYLGYDVRLYDASFQEWGNDETLPITSPVTIDPGN